MNKLQRIEKINYLLKRDYPEVITPLYHQSAFQLLTATILSAQTLDETVNKVTPTLFSKYPDAEYLANADFESVDSIIKIVNYHKTKARNIIKMAKKVLDDFDGVVPHTIEDLTTLDGVGRKTANVLISEWFAKDINSRGNPVITSVSPNQIKVLPEGFVVDTHVMRTAKRLGLTKNTKPELVEQDLMRVFPREEWHDMSLRLIFHGRYRCKAKNPQCSLDEEWSLICSCCKDV